MEDNLVTVKVTDDQEFVAREMQRYDFTAMPVLDLSLIHISTIPTSMFRHTSSMTPRRPAA